MNSNLDSNYFIRQYINMSIEILRSLDDNAINAAVKILCELKGCGGRLFCMGIGGSASTASHAAADFRILCGIDASCPTDSHSFVTAVTNDRGFDRVFSEFLQGSHVTSNDTAIFYSVGGGQVHPPVSSGLVQACHLLRDVGAQTIAVVGRNGGELRQHCAVPITIPPLDTENVTFHTEGIALVIHHLMVSHPLLRVRPPKW